MSTESANKLSTDLPGQKALLHDRYSDGKWESPRILDTLGRTQELYFDRVSQIRMHRWSRGRVALVGDAAFCVSLMAGQGSAFAMTAAYVLAGELAKAAGRHEEAFRKYEDFLRAYIDSKQRGAERFAAAFAPAGFESVSRGKGTWSGSQTKISGGIGTGTGGIRLGKNFQSNAFQ